MIPLNTFGNSIHNRIFWSLCVCLLVAGCSKTSEKDVRKQKSIPIKYAIIGDTLFPMQYSYEVHEINEDRSVNVRLKKDLDQGSVDYSYNCSEGGSKKDLDLKNAEKRFEEFYKTINSNDGVYLKKITEKYTQFKTKKAFIHKTQLSYRGEKGIDSEDQTIVFNFNGKQYFLLMSIFKPTESTRAYSYDMWERLSDGILLLKRISNKIECSINKIDINNKGMKIEYTITNKSLEPLKINRQSILYAFFRIKLNQESILKESVYPRIAYMSPYLPNEYQTLEPNKSYHLTNDGNIDAKYINPKIINLLRNGRNPVQFNYEYKTDIVLIRNQSKALSLQTISNKGDVKVTYSTN